MILHVNACVTCYVLTLLRHLNVTSPSPPTDRCAWLWKEPVLLALEIVSFVGRSAEKLTVTAGSDGFCHMHAAMAFPDAAKLSFNIARWALGCAIIYTDSTD